jgi:hypothetical protein
MSEDTVMAVKSFFYPPWLRLVEQELLAAMAEAALSEVEQQSLLVTSHGLSR